MLNFSIEENTVSLLPDLTVTEMFQINDRGISRVEFYKYNGWVVAYTPCENGVWGTLHMDESFLSLYEGEDSYKAILDHSGILNKHRIITFRR